MPWPTYEAQRRSRPSLSIFLDEVALSGREFDNDKDERLRRNAVSLMTLHSAKGLEFSRVYMVGMEEGILPHRRSVDETASHRRGAATLLRRRHPRQDCSPSPWRCTRRKWGKATRDDPQPIPVRTHRPGRTSPTFAAEKPAQQPLRTRNNPIDAVPPNRDLRVPNV